MYNLFMIGIYIVVFLFGICIGSFLNVCIYRLPTGESLVKSSSHCMTCGTKIRKRDLVPLFSWLFLRGKCHACGAKISSRYPIVESLSGIMWVLAFMRYDIYGPYGWKALFTALFFSALIVVAFMDWDTQEINLGVLIFIGLLSVPSVFLTDDLTIPERLIGAACISLPFLLIAVITHGMGMGDVILMAVCGLLTGYRVTVVGAFFGIILGAVIGLILKKMGKGNKIAFGPWLSVGMALSVFFGEQLWQWYMGIIGFAA